LIPNEAVAKVIETVSTYNWSYIVGTIIMIIYIYNNYNNGGNNIVQDIKSILQTLQRIWLINNYI